MSGATGSRISLQTRSHCVINVYDGRVQCAVCVGRLSVVVLTPTLVW